MQDKFDNPGNNIVPKEGQPKCSDLSCNNVNQEGCPSLGFDCKFTKEEIDDFIELARILKGIHIRLLSEGYQIRDGVITPPSKNP